MTQDVRIKEYHKVLSKSLPKEMDKYFIVPEMKRLMWIGYFCGMDYCNKNIYDFRFYYSTLNHSEAVARIVWNYTHDLTQTISAFVHDISSPVYRHVIDFMNGDSLHQESTEEFTEKIIKKSYLLKRCLAADGIKVRDIIDYKMYPIADNERPKLSADRLEGVFSSNYIWNKTLNIDEIEAMYKDIIIVKNEDGIDEMAFKNLESAQRFFKEALILNNALAHNEDKFCMTMLAKMTEIMVDNKKLSINGIYRKTEIETNEMFAKTRNNEVKLLWTAFKNMNEIKRCDSIFEIPKDSFYADMTKLVVKQRYVDPLVVINNKVERILSFDNEAKLLMQKSQQFKDSNFAYVEIPKVLTKTYKK